MYLSTGEYEKATELFETSLVILKEIGNRNDEATCYANLGTVYKLVGEYEKARGGTSQERTRDQERNWTQKRRSYLLWRPGNRV